MHPVIVVVVHDTSNVAALDTYSHKALHLPCIAQWSGFAKGMLVLGFGESFGVILIGDGENSAEKNKIYDYFYFGGGDLLLAVAYQANVRLWAATKLFIKIMLISQSYIPLRNNKS